MDRGTLALDAGSAPGTISTPRRARLIAGIAVTLTLAATAVGGLLSTDVISTGSPPPPDAARPAGPFGLRQAIPISFGALRVTGAQQLGGPSARKLGGVTHGIQSLVPPDKVQVQPRIVLSNLLQTSSAYSLREFTLLAAKDGVRRGGSAPSAPPRGARRYRPTGATVDAGTLRPGGSIEAQLTFVAPRNGSRLWLEFREPGRDTPVVVDLGRTGQTPAGAFDGYHIHGGTGR